MSEHEDVMEHLRSLEAKLDVFIRASGFTIIMCDDAIHSKRSYDMGPRPCETCGGWERRLIAKKHETEGSDD